MKTTHTCPKCRGTQILLVPGNVGPYGSGNNIAASVFSAVKVHRYICRSCGYSEEWIDKEDLPKLEKRYK